MPPKPKAKWTIAGNPTVALAEDGTMSVAVGLRDNGVLAATLRFTITADRALKLVVDNEPGSAGLTDFQAWSDL